MKKFQHALIKGAFNPFHYGHLHLLKKTYEISNSVDIYIGNKSRPHRLPREIRSNSLKNLITNLKWENDFNIIDSGKYTDLNLSNYDLYATGSDLPNVIIKNISTRGKIIPEQFKKMYFAFPNILIPNREEMPLKKEAKKKLENKQINLIEISGSQKTSGRKIRNLYRNNQNISNLIPTPAWETIKDCLHYFN